MKEKSKKYCIPIDNLSSHLNSPLLISSKLGSEYDVKKRYKVAEMVNLRNYFFILFISIVF
jgi:hypothetical protein